LQRRVVLEYIKIYLARICAAAGPRGWVGLVLVENGASRPRGWVSSGTVGGVSRDNFSPGGRIELLLHEAIRSGDHVPATA
jgi:hypothetical protein